MQKFLFRCRRDAVSLWRMVKGFLLFLFKYAKIIIVWFALKVFHLLRRIFRLVKKSRKLQVGIVLSVVSIVAGFFLVKWYLFDYENGFFVVPDYIEVSPLALDTYSRSADIKITIPKDMHVNTDVQPKIRPYVRGRWKTVDDSTITFDPLFKFKKDQFYTVLLSSEQGLIGKEFFVEDDPAVISVLPGEDAEIDEESNITITFNRAMTPLTTRIRITQEDLPSVKITPQTEGYFQWMGTRTLQFVPVDELLPASKYEIHIDNNLQAIDGVGVEKFSAEFTTRHLRLKTISQERISFDEPISVSFNQGVDIESFEKEVSVLREGKKNIDVIIEYAKNDEEQDTSTILIYNKLDKYGRERLWDAGVQYEVSLKNLSPQHGTFGLKGEIKTIVTVPHIIEKVEATSDRFKYPQQYFFDPEGTLNVIFSEEIDIEKSHFENAQIKNIAYGQKCKFENVREVYNFEQTCEKVTDFKRLLFSFKSKSIGLNADIVIMPSKLVNRAGVELITDDVRIEARTFPSLDIRRTDSTRRRNTSTAKYMILCSTTPLQIDGNGRDMIKSSQKYRFEHMYSREGRTTAEDTNRSCDIGEFETSVSYQIMPDTEYTFTISASDVFGQSKTIEETFVSGSISKYDSGIISYHAQQNVTTPERTKLSYSLVNLSYVDVHFCKMTPEQFLYRNSNIRYRDRRKARECIEEKTERVDVGEGMYWDPVQFSIDLKDYFSDVRGYYEITMTNPDYVDYDGGLRKKITYLSVTTIGVVQKNLELQSRYDGTRTLLEEDREGAQNLYWVFDMNNLDELDGAHVDLYESTTDSDIVKKSETTTDKKGLAYAQPFMNYAGGVVYHHGDSAIVGISANSLDYVGSAETVFKTYLYSDRPIYRPGDDVHIKGIVRAGFDGAYRFVEGDTVTLSIRDGNNSVIVDDKVAISRFGTINTTIQLPGDAALGDYSIEIIGKYAGRAVFDVQEYVPSPFKVGINFDKEDYTNGENVEIAIDAKYFFGAAVQEGEVTYSISTQKYYFDKSDDPAFANNRYWHGCYYGCDFGDTFVTENTATLGKDGKAKIVHKIDFDKWFDEENRDSSVITTVRATVKNANGQSVSHQQSFIAHKGQYYLGVYTDNRFTPTNSEVELKVKSVDITGKDMGADKLTLTIFKNEWTSSKRQAVDGGFYYDSKLELVKKDEMKLSTNDHGDWTGSYSFEQSGSYELRIEGIDDLGNTISQKKNIYVWGDGRDQVRRTNNTELEVRASKQSVSVGDTAELFFESPFQKAKALISIERGHVYEHEIIDVDESYVRYGFSVEKKYIPNVYGSVTLISEYPEVKHGNIQFHVDRNVQELDVSVKAQKENYLPGEEVELDVSVRDYQGVPVQAEVSIAAVDLSVLALKGNPKKNPLLFFYDGFPLTIETSSNIKNIIYEANVSSDTKGGGGMNPDDLAKRKRGTFRDTAFWKHDVVTDANGRAHVTFTLPDNLTSWQVESVAITPSTKVGVNYEEFVTKKDILIKPIVPRFVIPGDKFSLGAQVFNQTKVVQSLVANIDSPTLHIGDENIRNISIEPGASQMVYFDVQAPVDYEDGVHMVTMSVEGNEFEDVVEKSINIAKNTTYEVVATSGTSKSQSTSEFIYVGDQIVADQGDVTISHSATLAVFLEDAFEYLLKYPYGCSEQIATKLKGIAQAKRALNIDSNEEVESKSFTFEDEEYSLDEAVEKGLDNLFKNQKTSGGFVYFGNSVSKEDFFLTLYVTQTLNTLKKAGYDIPQSRLDLAYGYIARNTSTYVKSQKRKNEESIYIFVANTLSEGGALGQHEKVIKQIHKITKDKKYLYDDSNSMALAMLATVVADNPDLFKERTVNKVFTVLENRIHIDSRGAFIGTIEGNVFERFYETSTNDTALALKAMVRGQRDYVHMDKIIRWLLRSRNAQGVWETTNSTGNVLDAFVELVEWRGERENSFDVDVVFNSELIDSFAYNKDTITTQNQSTIEMDKVTKNAMNNVTFKKRNSNDKVNELYYDVQLRYAYPLQDILATNEGLGITRNYYYAEDTEMTTPLEDAKVGDVLRGRIEVTVPLTRYMVGVESFLPAGLSLINTELATEYVNAFNTEDELNYLENNVVTKKDLKPSQTEFRDDRLFLFNRLLQPGVYTYDYFVRVQVPGTFQQLPAVASEMYFPENFGRTKGSYFTVK